MKRFSLALTLAATLCGSSAFAFDMNAMSENERLNFRKEIRSYLLENPEVLLEAIKVLEQRDSQAQAGDDASLIQVNAEALYSDPASYVGGNPDGDITMVEFLDYRCGYCRKAHGEVAELISSDGNIRLIVKEFPILGEQSERAARFAIATLQIEGSDAYHLVNDKLMTLRSEISTESLDKLARDLGLNGAAVMKTMDSDEVTMVIAENRALAQRLQITGTPGFVVGDMMMRGYLPLEDMRDVVKDLRSQ